MTRQSRVESNTGIYHVRHCEKNDPGMRGRDCKWVPGTVIRQEGCRIAYNAGQRDVDTTNCKIDGNAFWDCQEDMKMMDGVNTKRTVPAVFPKRTVPAVFLRGMI